MTAKSVFSFVQIAKFLVAATTIALTFVACGDDSGNSNAANNENIGNTFDEVREVATTQDLGSCTSEREGDTVYVVEKMRDYICINHAWIDASENLGTTPSGEENTPSSSSKAEPPSTHRDVEDVYSVGECSINIEVHTVFVKSNLVTYICEDGVWSVYIAPNTQTSSSSAISSTVPAYFEIADIMQLGKCTKESANAVALVKKDTSYYTCVNGNWIQSEEHGYVIQKRSILGVAQKGPFKFGAPVYLRELAGDDLHYTGKIYKDEISSNKGDFVIPNVNLIYPYASVEVRGLYRNEVTGKYSDVELSLFTLTDLQTDNRTKVNVNLLTHLEYVRAMHLVRKGYSVYAAKRQADQEIMTAFELPTTVKFSEDLSVFEDSEDDNVDYANASLMVLNLLFLGERSDAEVVALIDSFAKDFEKDGVWDDDSTKAAMADFATEINGDEIRANVKAWNILDIPAFESQMEMFWNNVYGLGGCTSVRNGVIANNKNKFSKNFEVYYKCGAGSWVKATQLEYDTYGWDAGTVGEVKKGDVTDAKYVYRDGKWNQASVAEGGLGSCLAKNEGTILTYGPSYGLDYYVCKSRQWTKLTVAEADVYGWSAGTVGEVKKGTYTEAKYVYRNGKWNTASTIESALGSCTSAYAGTVKKNESTYYICKSSAWTTASVLEYDTYGWEAGTNGEVKKGDVTDAKYVYRNGAWSAASAVEASLGSCLAKDEGSILTYNSDYYACESSKWTKITATQADIYGWSAGEDGEVKKGTYTDTKYVYKDGKWGIADDLETLLGSCVAENANTVILKDGSYYACENTQWKELSEFEADTYGWSTGEVGEVKKGAYTDAKYVYRDGKWNVASSIESALGSCVSNNAGVVKENETVFYICKSNAWTIATVLEYDTYGLICSKDGAIVDGAANCGNKYVCDAEIFRDANENEINLNLGCTNYNQNQSVFFEDDWESVTWICSEKWIDKRAYKYGSLTDDRDGKIYKTVKIGTQIWMAENLNYNYNKNTAVSYCFNNNLDSCAKYGRLYLWSAAMDSAAIFSSKGKWCGEGGTCFASGIIRGVCPEGWHLPSNDEWNTMLEHLASAVSDDASNWYYHYDVGTKLKSVSGWSSGNGTDAYGFSALPAGVYNHSYHGDFWEEGNKTYFWSSTESNNLNAYCMSLIYRSEIASLHYENKSYGRSVRCLKDSDK